MEHVLRLKPVCRRFQNSLSNVFANSPKTEVMLTLRLRLLAGSTSACSPARPSEIAPVNR